VTPTPSPTPYPLTAFSLLFTVIQPGEAQPMLYAAAGDGSGPRLLGAGISEAVYDPSGRFIAFVRQTTTTTGEGDDAVTVSGSELFVAPADNLDAARQITTLGSNVTGPAWAPDGIRIAFSSDTSGIEEIYTITEDGNNLRQITFEEGTLNRDPIWSPDGESIVFASDRDSPGLTRLYRMSALGEDLVLLTRTGGSSFMPRWSPDGRLIVFINDANGDADVYTMEPNGEGVYLLTAGDGSAEDRSPVFTPDSRLVAFASNREGDVFQLFTVDLRGTVVTRLTQDDNDYQALDYKPEPLLRLIQN
jgi:TolB protein